MVIQDSDNHENDQTTRALAENHSKIDPIDVCRVQVGEGADLNGINAQYAGDPRVKFMEKNVTGTMGERMNCRSAGRKRFLAAVLVSGFASGMFFGDIAVAQQVVTPAALGPKPAVFPQAPAASVTQKKPVMEVSFKKGFLQIKAKDANIRELLTAICEKAAVGLSLDPMINGRVTIDFQGSLMDGVRDVLITTGGKNFAVEFVKKPRKAHDEFAIDKISILRKATIEEPTAAEIQAAILKRDQEYRELFAKMDKGRNKIARALKECVDPKTSAEKKIKLRTYLRQTPIDDPADKRLLKGASLDPQYSEILDEMEMALLHAIQDKPEESDKEYILDLLRRDIKPGWLLYGMLDVWDDRYVPYLLEYVKKGGSTAIEILGRAKVKEAVPLLEKALYDKDGEVRKSAYYALLKITGKEYEVRFKIQVQHLRYVETEVLPWGIGTVT